jgi:hypothetical protein
VAEASSTTSNVNGPPAESTRGAEGAGGTIQAAGGPMPARCRGIRSSTIGGSNKREYAQRPCSTSCRASQLGRHVVRSSARATAPWTTDPVQPGSDTGSSATSVTWMVVVGTAMREQSPGTSMQYGPASPNAKPRPSSFGRSDITWLASPIASPSPTRALTVVERPATHQRGSWSTRAHDKSASCGPAARPARGIASSHLCRFALC